MKPVGIPFNIPLQTGAESGYLDQVLQSGYFAGDGRFTRACQQQLRDLTGSAEVLLTTSCTHALEMAALLCNIGPGDEVILPSFTFVSTANAFALRGAQLVYVDLDPRTMNAAPKAIEKAISSKTKAVVLMHYAGIACDMPAILELCRQRGLFLIEDAAHCVQATFQEQPLGTFGHLGAFSFHHTKNIHCGEGGALLVNDPELAARAQTIRDKGTNRQAFLRGEVSAYSWVDIGSSYLLNELSAAFLLAQLEAVLPVTEKRRMLWHTYEALLQELADAGRITLPQVPEGCRHNGHLFYFQCGSAHERTDLLAHLNQQDIGACFHYVPLHSSMAGRRWGHFEGLDQFTTTCSQQLIRLPLYFELEPAQCRQVAAAIRSFYAKK